MVELRGHIKASQTMKSAFFFAPILALAGCASSGGLVTSLDDLAADVSISGVFDFEQARAISISGLAPNVHAGGVVRYTAGRTPFTAIGISNISFSDDDPAARTESYIVQRDLALEPEEGPPLDYLLDLRNSMLDVRLKASELIRAIAAETVAQQVALQKEESTEEPTEAPPSPQADNNTEQPATDKESPLETAQRKTKEARTSFDEAYNEVIKAVRPGVKIIRVSKKNKGESTFGLGSLLGLSKEGESEVTGFAILGDLRYEILYAGEDLSSVARGTRTSWKLIGEEFPYLFGFSKIHPWFPIPIPHPGQFARDDIWVVTSSLKAKYILYAQDKLSEEKIEANLEAAYSDFSGAKNFKDFIEKVDKIKVSSVLETVRSLGNTGVLGSPSETLLPLSELQEQLRTKQPSESGYQTVYQVATDYADIASLCGADENPGAKDIGVWAQLFSGDVRFELGLVDLIGSISN